MLVRQSQIIWTGVLLDVVFKLFEAISEGFSFFIVVWNHSKSCKWHTISESTLYITLQGNCNRTCRSIIKSQKCIKCWWISNTQLWKWISLLTSWSFHPAPAIWSAWLYIYTPRHFCYLGRCNYRRWYGGLRHIIGRIKSRHAVSCRSNRTCIWRNCHSKFMRS